MRIACMTGATRGRRDRGARPATRDLVLLASQLAVGVDDTDVDRHVGLDEMMDGDAPCVYGVPT